MAFVYCQSGECRGRSGGPGPVVQGIVLKGSVGRGGQNMRDDATAVQDGLNRVSVAEGGAVVPLVADGLVGPKTIGAIERFQTVQFPTKFADGRIDPGQRTVQRLNEILLSRQAIAPIAASPTAAAFATPSSSFGIKQQSGLVQESIPASTTDDQIRLAETLAFDAERRIAAAVRRLNQAILALGKQTRTPAEQQLVREIDWHFKASADPNPITHMAKVQSVLATMLIAIREQNLGSRNIFRKGTHPDPTAIAAAELGGWHSMKQDERFIITPKFRTQSSAVIVHELGHFCGGNKTTTSNVVHRASPKPFPTGEKREDGAGNYRDMSPFFARTNVYSYQIYCFPEEPEFKVP